MEGGKRISRRIQMTHDDYWRYYAKQNRKMERLGVRIITEAVKSILSVTVESIERRGAQTTLLALDSVVSRITVEQAYLGLYTQVGTAQIKWAEADIRKRTSGKKEERQPVRRPNQTQIGRQTAFGFGFENPAWLVRLREITASIDFNERISSVTDTIRQKISRSLTEAVGQYVTTSKIISKLKRDVGAKWTRVRASLVARTEVTYIANLAAEQAATELKIDLKKIWVRTLDSRTRDAHRNVIRTPIDADKKFMVGGLPMDKPGDPAGGIANTANCRCVVAYLPADDTEDFDDL